MSDIQLEANRNIVLLDQADRRNAAERDALQDQWYSLRERLEELMEETPVFIHDYSSDEENEGRLERASHWASRWPTVIGHRRH